jgi:hypothetical protein
MRQFPGLEERPGDLEEAEAHQIGAERDAQVDEPARQFEVGRDLVGANQGVDEFRPHGADDEGEQRPTEQAEQNHLLATHRRKLVDQHVDADMDAGAHPIGGAELRHPHEHVDAKLLRPGQVDRGHVGIEERHARGVAMHDRDEDEDRRGPDEGCDHNLFEPIEDAKKQGHSPQKPRRLGRSSLLAGPVDSELPAIGAFRNGAERPTGLNLRPT